MRRPKGAGPNKERTSGVDEAYVRAAEGRYLSVFDVQGGTYPMYGYARTYKAFGDDGRIG